MHTMKDVALDTKINARTSKTVPVTKEPERMTAPV